MNRFRKWATSIALGISVGTAQAALIDRGGGMIYDTTFNITWLSDWNYAATSGYAAANAGGTRENAIFADGRMGWAAANSWANNLVYGGFSDWRLPTAVNADGTGPCGPSSNSLNCSGSEMGHMFYVDWGATARSDWSSGANTANLALFSNVQSYCYWSGTNDPPAMRDIAWSFFTRGGWQGVCDELPQEYAVAVRLGDVVDGVPEPQTLVLVLLGLVATIVSRRRRVGQRVRVLRRLGIA